MNLVHLNLLLKCIRSRATPVTVVVIAVLLGSSRLATAASAEHSPVASVASPAAADSVWMNLSSKVYHCLGSQYFGNTKRGRFSTEAEARSLGFRPAYNKPCQQSANPRPVLGIASGTARTASRSSAASADTKVWVNSASNVYHCPGARYYGNTKRGSYMSESDARSSGNRPAYGRSCT